MDSGHEANFDAPLLIEKLNHCSHRVGGARTCGNNCICWGQDVVVYTVYNGRSGVVLSRSGDKNLLSACIQVSLGLLSRSVEAGALKNVLNTIILYPWDILSIAFCVYWIFLTVNHESSVSCGNLICSAIVMLEWTLAAVVLEQVSEHGWGGQIVDCCNIDVTSCTATVLKLENTTECETTDTAETVNTNLYCHLILPYNCAVIYILLYTSRNEAYCQRVLF